MAEGNHDPASSIWLRALFGALYENEPRVEVIDSPLPCYVHQHGQTMIACTTATFNSLTSCRYFSPLNSSACRARQRGATSIADTGTTLRKKNIRASM